MRTYQNWILKNLKAGNRHRFLFWNADNITRANYADFLWPDKPVSFRAHFMFHTPKENNGFSDGKHIDRPHSDWFHCCWCGDERACFDHRVSGV